MFRTMANVTGGIAAAAIVGRSERSDERVVSPREEEIVRR
jgi:hypothetical protein